MARITPFRGILYNQKKVHDLSKVTAPPYDVITPEEQERLYRRSPHNVVRLILNRDPDHYESVARLFESWQAEEILVRDEAPAIYFLSHRFTLKEEGEKERKGFIALTRIEDFSSGKIRPHEMTLEGPKEDRFRLMLACRANLSPIFALYSQPKQTINRMLTEQVEATPPLIQATDNGGGSCLLWRVADPEIIRQVQREMEDQTLLIADGHHRYEAALNFRNHWRRERATWSGREAFHYLMIYFASMEDRGLAILPTHRQVKDFPPIPFQKLEEELQRYFYLEPYPKTHAGEHGFLRTLKSGKKRHLIGVSFKGDPRYLILRLKNKRIMQRLAPEMSAPLRELDVTTLHLLILEHILGLRRELQLQREVMSYSEDAEEVLRAVDEGSHRAAFILNPPRPEEILAVAQEGEKMPQKSTYFYPKLISGLVINKIDPNEEVVEGL